MKEAKPKYRLYSPEYVSSPFGLNNNGAICWFNSVVQFLLGIPQLSAVLLENREELAHNELAAECVRTLDGLLPNSTDMEPIIPAHFAGVSGRLLTAMIKGGVTGVNGPTGHTGQTGPNVSSTIHTGHVGGLSSLGYGQQCAAEGFTTFIESLRSTEVDNLFCNAYKQIIICRQCKKEVSSVRDTANRINVPPTKNFATADEQSTWRVYTSGLPFSHPHRHVIKNFTTEDEFQKWIMSHAAVTLDYTCDQCNHKMQMVLRGERLSMLREVIVVSFDMIDRMDATWFPAELSFPTIDGGTLRYKLCGKICWSGNVNKLKDGRIASGGHYWAHSLRENTWQCLNDGSVTPGNPYPEKSVFMIAYSLFTS